MKLSVVMPCYNEAKTVERIVDRVLEQPFDIELIIVDDCSTDGTREVLAELARKHRQVRVLLQTPNMGKGAALRRGFENASGDIVLVQDADLEYDPTDYAALVAPILRGEADVVYGSRFLAGPHRVLYFWHSVGNKALTLLSNMITDLNLTDMETCYKVFRRDVLRAIQVEEPRFGFEPEVTSKISRIAGIRIWEIAISYNGRTYAEGKKIGMKDALRAVYVMVKYGVLKQGKVGALPPAPSPKRERLVSADDARAAHSPSFVDSVE